MTNSDKWIDDLVGALHDPIIVMPNGWGDSLPDWIAGQIKMERLIENMHAAHHPEETRMASDAEAVAYMYTASMDGPMGRDWSDIYLSTAKKVMLQYKPGTNIPSDIEVRELNQYQQDHLRRLKIWIYERRIKHRQEVRREERAEAAAYEPEVPKEPESKPKELAQLAMFKF